MLRRFGRFAAVAMAISCGVIAMPVVAGDLQFPDSLEAVGDPADADVVVLMEIAADGGARVARIERSSRPESDAQVLAALGAWRFSATGLLDKSTAASSRLRGFRFRDTRAERDASGAVTAARFLVNPGFNPAFEAGANEDDAAARNAVWLDFPGGYPGAKGDDPVVVMEAAIDSQGCLVAMRSPNEADAMLIAWVLNSRPLWDEARFEMPAAQHEGTEPRRVSFDARFLQGPKARQALSKVLRFPPELFGTSGSVRIEGVIGTDGRMADPTIVGASHPKYEASVIEGLRKAVPFEPAWWLGKPVAVRTAFVVKYVTPGGDEKSPFAFTGSAANREKLPEAFRFDAPPRVSLAVDPVYPYDLALASVSGSATVHLVVDPFGQVNTVNVIEATEPAFGAALKAAMELWQFEPATREGKPVWATFSRRHEFSMSSFAANPLDPSARRLLKKLRKGDTAELGAADAPLQSRLRTAPEYPLEWRGASGAQRVSVEFIVDDQGNAQLPRAIAYQEEPLAWAALTAVARWRFDPPQRGGKAADVRTRVDVLFQPPADSTEASAAPAAP